MAAITKESALQYHQLDGKPGKLEIIPTKPLDTQTDLGLAYTPGVAYPVLEIANDPQMAYEYTNKETWWQSSPMARPSLGWVTVGHWRANPSWRESRPL